MTTRLVITAHADDSDYFAGGTIKKWTEQGDDVYLLVLTDSSKGIEAAAMSAADVTAARNAEQVAAAQILGIKEVFYGHFTDGELKNNKSLRCVITRYIRQIKPDTVMGWDPKFRYSTKHKWANHPDHEVAGRATLHCVSLFARNAASFPELLNEGLEPHIVSDVWFFTLRKKYNHVEDITGTMPHKLEAMWAHATQTRQADEDMVVRWAGDIGWLHDVFYAEAFKRLEIGH